MEQIDLVFLSRLSSASGKSIRFGFFLFVFVIVVDVLGKKTWPEVFSFSFFLFFFSPVKWYGANLALFFLGVNFYIDYIVNNKIYEK